MFQFDWPTPIDGGKWGAHHGLDVPFVFDNAAITPHIVGAGAEQLALADPDEPRLDRVRAHRRSEYVRACRRGRPSISHAAATMVFDRESRVVDDPRGRERRLFGQVPYVQPGT